MITGHDIASYQSTVAPRGDFTFIKATEGTYYVNPKMVAQASSARTLGQVVGFYHFLHPGNPIGQAAYFVEHADSREGDVFICDWEMTQQGHASSEEKDQFLAEVKRLRPTHRVLLYCNTSDWTSLDKSSKCGDGLWIAQYNGKPGRADIKHPWLIHQYSSTPIDNNVAQFRNRAAMKTWARGLIAKPAPAKSAPAAVSHPNFDHIRDAAKAAMSANPKGSKAYKAAAKVLDIIRPFSH